MNNLERKLLSYIRRYHPVRYHDKVFTEYCEVLYGERIGNHCAITEIKLATGIDLSRR